MIEQQITNLFTVAGLAIASRLAVLLLGKLVSIFFSRFDYSSFTSPVKSPFKYLETWDTIHYINISNSGYTHEHSLPFFPLVPLMVRVLNVTDVLTTGVIISNLAFVASAMVFYKITRIFFQSRFSMLSTVIFIFNPASIIYSTYYTESVFTLVFLLGLFYTIRKQEMMASLLFAISTFCRSNGMLFIIFQKLMYVPVTLLPISLFQLYSLALIWEHTMNFKLVVPYSLVQAKYWEQGFLRFIRLRNTPNIIIGTPVMLLSSFFLYRYFRSVFYGQKQVIRCTQKIAEETENIANTTTKVKEAPKKVYFYDMELEIDRDDMKSLQNQNIVKAVLGYSWMPFHGSEIHKTAALLLLQIIMLVFLIHWNIAMRFIAHNPFFYWSAAYFAQKYSRNVFFRQVCTFFTVYGLLYIIMFSCFYPPP